MSEREIKEPGVVEEVASGRLGERVRSLRREQGLRLWTASRRDPG